MTGAGSENTKPNDSLEAIYIAHESELLTYARKLVHDEETAQDIVQEAFMRLHSVHSTVNHPKAWLYRTVHNLAVNHNRHTGKVVQVQFSPDKWEKDGTNLEDQTDTQILPDERVVRTEAIAIAKSCIDKLDERSKTLVRLKFEEGLSYKEISERTGLSVSNVGYILHHALKQIANDLKDAGVSL